MVDESLPLQRLVVVGHGLVAAGTAVTLARLLTTPDTRIDWVRPADPEPGPAVEVAHPAFVRWLEMVGLGETELLAAGRGLYTLGVHYQGEKTAFFLPHGSHGISPSPAPFEQEFFCRFSGEDQLAFCEHFLATQAALRGRFDFPLADPRSVKSTLRYGMHLERAGLIAVLEKRARALGVAPVDCQSVTVERDEQGLIAAVRPDGGAPITGDFFIDATGERAELIGETLDEFWRPSGGVRYRRHTRVEAADSPWRACAEITRQPRGWRRRTGLQDRVLVDDWQLPPARGEADDTPDAHRPGRRECAWVGNCLALGGAAARPGDLVLSEWHWSCRCLLLWLELLPDRTGRPQLRDEFNRRYRELVEAVGELELMHAASAGHTDTLPEALEWSLTVFQRFGRRWRRDEEPLADETWVALALGLGWYPESSDVMLADSDPEALRNKHERIMQALVRSAQAMPTLESVMKELDKKR